MPNGGSDCCLTCNFNKAVQEMGYPHPQDQKEKFIILSHCTLRDVNITIPVWTYSRNNHAYDDTPPLAKTEREEPIGWIYAMGIEGYRRIPWHGKIEPKIYTPSVCTICGRKTDKGITVIHSGMEVGFCTNRHYIDWWKTKHDDPEISSDGHDTPEEYYK